MKAAIVTAAGKTPTYFDFPDPVLAPGEVQIAVSAAALSPLVKGRAAGTHYSSSGQFPFVVGVDGVGRLDDGRRVYFVLPKPPLGAMSEKTVVRPSQCIPLPDGLDDVTAAAIANPGMSSWAALTERAKFVKGESVLVNGATGTAGRLAIQIAKHMGAGKVIATGRNTEILQTLGADVTIPIGEAVDAFEDALKQQFADRVDVVLDYLWGPSAERILIAGAKAGKDAVPIRFVQIGSTSAPNITLPGAALRSSAITMMGSGIGSVPLEGLVNAISQLLQAAVSANFHIATQALPLSGVEKVWTTAYSNPRIVFQIP